MPITIDIDSKSLQAALTRLAQATADLHKPLDSIGAAVANNTRLRFPDQRAPSGAPWKPLSAVTLARRRKGGKGAQALLDTGRLRASVTHEVHGDTVEIGTNVEYAPPHQFGARKGQFGRTKRGAPIPWGDIPARPFLGVNDDDADEIIEIIRKHLENR